MANRHSSPHDDVVKRMKAREAWRQKESKCWDHCAACDLKGSFQRRNNGKRTCQAVKTERTGLRIMWRDKPLWLESEFKMQRQQLCKS